VPIPIGLGDIANRLRRALAITGRIPTALDETIVPVAIVRTADELPYALDPLAWEIGQEVQGGAAELSTLGFTNEGDPRSVAIVDELTLQVGVADTRVEISRSGVKQTAIAPASTKKAADMSSKCQGLTTALDTGILGSAWNLDITTVGSIGRIIRCTLTPIVIPIQVVLRFGETLYVKTLTDNIRITVGARGRYWSNLVDS
jgi:hypothetical protein